MGTASFGRFIQAKRLNIHRLKKLLCDRAFEKRCESDGRCLNTNILACSLQRPQHKQRNAIAELDQLSMLQAFIDQQSSIVLDLPQAESNHELR